MCYTNTPLLRTIVLSFGECNINKNNSLYNLLGGFPGRSVVKNLLARAGDLGSIAGSERFPGKEDGNPLQYCCLGNPMDREAWWTTVRGVTKEWDLT